MGQLLSFLQAFALAFFSTWHVVLSPLLCGISLDFTAERPSPTEPSDVGSASRAPVFVAWLHFPRAGGDDVCLCYVCALIFRAITGSPGPAFTAHLRALCVHLQVTLH